MTRSRQPTSRDVAALAGVSVATVSYVMNGRTDRRIPAETRDRVLEAAGRLAYAPNRSARSLRNRRTEQVCLVVGSIGVPAYDQLAQDIHDRADEAGYGVLTIVVNSPARAAKAVELLQQRIADGAVIAPDIRFLDGAELTGLARGGLPMVVMSNTAPPDGFDVVRAPQTPACDAAFDHLFGAGRRRVAFVGHRYEVDDPSSSERMSAYLAALERHGAEPDPSLVVTGADDRVAAYHAVTALLDRPDPPDAVFAASARAGVSAIWAARDAGAGVPGELAVVGAGNLPESLITRPALSTVGPATEDDFTEVARLLFDRIDAGVPERGRELSDPWAFHPRGSS
ncbi:LacI family DNA-binding transcriptional regulator [Jiangella sp. DSM 45060]|uniref:LacI family DNA-binding transcriptional regulator n=1 Tax=Jiangella sp. DSM 45060 TaxID=1798224 RepID=UPI00087B9F76|nr:LacI family DNA-binding transcriptional regulator [Jiangella sp. DSM 45060]SDS82894.1 LacI family transcriptional regulator [Jiangella sp. DSM 45060]